MKKRFKFIAPNGEYVEWSEFDGRKQILTFEVEKFNDDGTLNETEIIDFMLPEDCMLSSNFNITSVYKKSN